MAILYQVPGVRSESFTKETRFPFIYTIPQIITIKVVDELSVIHAIIRELIRFYERIMHIHSLSSEYFHDCKLKIKTLTADIPHNT